MPAGVAEGPDLAVGSAHHDDRRAGRFAGDVRARLGQRRRRTERRGRAPQDAFDLQPQAAPAIDSSRPARATPPGRHPSCHWRCDRAPAAPPTDHPLPLSFLPSLACCFAESYARRSGRQKKPELPCVSLIQLLCAAQPARHPQARAGCVARMQHRVTIDTKARQPWPEPRPQLSQSVMVITDSSFDQPGFQRSNRAVRH